MNERLGSKSASMLLYLLSLLLPLPPLVMPALIPLSMTGDRVGDFQSGALCPRKPPNDASHCAISSTNILVSHQPWKLTPFSTLISRKAAPPRALTLCRIVRAEALGK